VCVCVWHLIFTGTIQLTAVTLPHTNTETTHNYGCQSRFLLRFPWYPDSRGQVRLLLSSDNQLQVS